MEIVEMNKILNKLKCARIRLSVPFFTYEFRLNELIDPENVDERIKKLDSIRDDLEMAINAIHELKQDAVDKKVNLLY